MKPQPIRCHAELGQPPTEEQWQRAIDEAWPWFEKNLGRTPCAYDVQMWIDGYVPGPHCDD